jgi:hypothetical protein
MTQSDVLEGNGGGAAEKGAKEGPEAQTRIIAAPNGQERRDGPKFYIRPSYVEFLTGTGDLHFWASPDLKTRTRECVTRNAGGRLRAFSPT